MKARNTILALAVGLLGLVPLVAQAQTGPANQTDQTKVARTDLSPISLEVRDAPLRRVLQQIFNTAKVDYSIDNSVTGYVTLRVTDQPFDNALRLVLRASPEPLSYTVDSGVYIVKPRPENAVPERYIPPVPAQQIASRDTNDGPHFEQIQLTYLDPADVAQILGLINLPTFSRQFGGGQGGGTSASRGGSYGNTGALGLGGIGGVYSDNGTGNGIFGNFTNGTGYGNYTPGAPAAPGNGNTSGNR